MLVDHLTAHHATATFDVVGSLRRGAETVGDLDILATNAGSLTLNNAALNGGSVSPYGVVCAAGTLTLTSATIGIENLVEVASDQARVITAQEFVVDAGWR